VHTLVAWWTLHRLRTSEGQGQWRPF
jgi:hypothetical protein